MEQPRGKLIAIGGAEDKGTVPEKGEIQKLSNLNFIELGILNRIVKESGGAAAKIEVITTASMIPNEVGEKAGVVEKEGAAVPFSAEVEEKAGVDPSVPGV